METLVHLTAENPDQAMVFNDLGALNFQKGQNREALRYFKRTAEMEPESILIQKMIADLYTDMGEIYNAPDIYQKLNEPIPGHDDVGNRISVLSGTGS
jgi:predicted Zn-dependent protease